MKGSPKRAVFLDRDGTISVEVGYVNHPDRFNLLPNSAQAVELLNRESILAIVTTNQAGVARGYFEEFMILKVHEKMEKLLYEQARARLDAIYYCPHHPSVGGPGYRVKCSCRKPGTLMIEQACERFGLNPCDCYVVGDKNSDVAFAHKIGARGVQVLTGYGKGEYEYYKDKWTHEPEFIASDLLEAVKWIIRDVENSDKSINNKVIDL
jgi:D-glycero-D-manno-heptose 1,7-bisphosphate phosphatase